MYELCEGHHAKGREFDSSASTVINELWDQ